MESLSTHDLLDAQAHVWNQIFNFIINSMSLKCAIQLGIPDIIHKHGKPITLSELASALSINEAKSHNLTRPMRIPIHSKFFVKIIIAENQDEEGYWLTPASRLLLTNEPFNMTSFALVMCDPVLLDPWQDLAGWFKHDSTTPFANTHGQPFWEYAGREPKLNQLFNDGMSCDSHMVAHALAKDYREVFEGLKTLVDVAGGTGVMAQAIADAVPGLKCVVLELPNVVDGLEGTHNLSFIRGDMFHFIPQADAVLLKWILHDWSDDECVRLLKKCKGAIPATTNGGKVIIIDIVLDHNEEHERVHDAYETQLFFDMLMMNLVSGKERTEKEWAKLFVDAGFNRYKIIPAALGARSLIQVFP